jgi:hypothetical protein
MNWKDVVRVRLLVELVSKPVVGRLEIRDRNGKTEIVMVNLDTFEVIEGNKELASWIICQDEFMSIAVVLGHGASIEWIVKDGVLDADDESIKTREENNNAWLKVAKGEE